MGKPTEEQIQDMLTTAMLEDLEHKSDYWAGVIECLDWVLGEGPAPIDTPEVDS